MGGQESQSTQKEGERTEEVDVCCQTAHGLGRLGTFLRQAVLLFLSSSEAKPPAGVAASPLQVGKRP